MFKVSSDIMAKVKEKRADVLNIIHCLSVNICPRCGGEVKTHLNSDDTVSYYCNRCVFVKNVPDVITIV